MRLAWYMIALCLGVSACGDREQSEQAALRRFASDENLAVRLNPAKASKNNGLIYEGLAGPRFRIADATAAEISALEWSMREVLPRTRYEFTLDVEKAKAATNSILRLETVDQGTRSAVDCGFDAASGALTGDSGAIEDRRDTWRLICRMLTGATVDAINVRVMPAAGESANQGQIVFRRLAPHRAPATAQDVAQYENDLRRGQKLSIGAAGTTGGAIVMRLPDGSFRVQDNNNKDHATVFWSLSDVASEKRYVFSLDVKKNAAAAFGSLLEIEMGYGEKRELFQCRFSVATGEYIGGQEEQTSAIAREDLGEAWRFTCPVAAKAGLKSVYAYIYPSSDPAPFSLSGEAVGALDVLALWYTHD